MDAANKPVSRPRHSTAFLLVPFFLLCGFALAGPSIAPGDLALRHDIQRLADYGVLSGPVTTWPLSWGPIMSDLRTHSTAALPQDVMDALARVRARAQWQTSTDELRFKARASVAERPALIRSFQDVPREDGELGAGVSWTGDRFSIDLSASAVADPLDGKDYRADGSNIAIALGNYTIAASTMDRWWGPGWDGSLILSNNARPIPAITIDRNFTDPFRSKWLSWIGPWDMSLIFGRMEENRAVPNARFFGFRASFKPIPSLEVGLSRTAQWCGDGRPCGFDTFVDLILGKDNVGSDGISTGNEPGNQLAGIDIRWSLTLLRLPIAVYSQFIGEDEAGGFPSRYIGQVGIEGTGSHKDSWSYRWYMEASATTCNFYESLERFNCAYNHSIYQSGYRYRGRVIGHGADNDAAIATIGLLLIDDDETSWQGLVRTGKLNRGGPPDLNHSLTPVPLDVVNVELVHSRIFSFGQLRIGVGYEQLDGNPAIPSSNEATAFIQWRSDY